jgi:hypothetical protein
MRHALPRRAGEKRGVDHRNATNSIETMVQPRQSDDQDWGVTP